LAALYITVDDTARAMPARRLHHADRLHNFTTFRTGPSKSRLAFLSRLCGASLYVITTPRLLI